MKTFETELQEQLDKLPYTKHLDDGQYNDGRHFGFEEGARWANERPLPTDQQLQDMAMAKFPVEKDEFGEDWNEKDRDKCLQALRDLVKVMGGQDE